MTTRNVAFVVLLAFLAASSGGAQQVASVERGAARPTLVPLVQRVALAVVNIAVVGTTRIESPLLQDTRVPATGNKLDGAELLRDLDRSDPRYRSFQGVLVAAVRPASAAWRAGFEAGDIIVAVNRRAVTTTDQLTAALRDARVPFAVEVERDGGRVFLVVQ